jgi:hypothetical protein
MGLTRSMLDELLDAVPALYLVSGPGVYVGMGQAVRVATWLGDRGVAILGIEGFKTDGEVVSPLLDFIADLSSSVRAGKSARELASAATPILENWRGQVEFVDFVINVE